MLLTVRMNIMISNNIIVTLSGVSGFLGFTLVLAYLYSKIHFSSRKRSLAELIEGDAKIGVDQFAEILEQFDSQSARLEALRQLTNYDSKKFQSILETIDERQLFDMHVCEQQNHARSRIKLASVFLLLALFGLLYSLLQQGPLN